MDKNAKNKSTITSILFTIGILIILTIAGPAAAVKLALLSPSDLNPEVGDVVSFEAHIDLESDEIVPFHTVVLDMNGVECEFEVSGGYSLTEDPLCDGLYLEKISQSGFKLVASEIDHYSNDFESGFQEWTHGPISGEIDSWEITTVAYGSEGFAFDSNVAGNTNNGNHNGYEQSYLKSPLLSLPEADNLWFTFNSYTANEGGCPVESDVEWVEIMNGSEWVRLNDCDDDEGHDYLHLDSDMYWREFSYDISEYAGQDVYLRFKYSLYDADGGPTIQEGWYVDNVEITTKTDRSQGTGFGDSNEEFDVLKMTAFYGYGYGYGYKYGYSYGQKYPPELPYLVTWDTDGYTAGDYDFHFYAVASTPNSYFKYKTQDPLSFVLGTTSGDDDDDDTGDNGDNGGSGGSGGSRGGGSTRVYRPSEEVNETVEVEPEDGETDGDLDVDSGVTQNETQPDTEDEEPEEDEITGYATGTLSGNLFNIGILLLFLAGLLLLILKSKK